MSAAVRPSSGTLPAYVIARVATSARTSLLAELNTWPKPGLVSHVDRGNHQDMDATTFEASAAAITPFSATLAEAGAAGAAMLQLRGIGMAAEREMLRVAGGINISAGARSRRIARSRIERSTRPRTEARPRSANGLSGGARSPGASSRRHAPG